MRVGPPLPTADCFNGVPDETIFMPLPAGTGAVGEVVVHRDAASTGTTHTLAPSAGDLAGPYEPAAGWLDDGRCAVTSWDTSLCTVENASVVAGLEIAFELSDVMHCLGILRPKIYVMANPQVPAGTVFTLTDTDGALVTVRAGAHEQ